MNPFPQINWSIDPNQDLHAIRIAQANDPEWQEFVKQWEREIMADFDRTTIRWLQIAQEDSIRPNANWVPFHYVRRYYVPMACAG